jgi:outer membrane lipoprotein-sorting protein
MLRRSFALALCFIGSAVVLMAAASTLTDPTPEQIQDIIKKFVQKETEFAQARENYTYRQTTKLTEVDPPGGNFEVVEEVSFDDRNRRTSHVTFAPVVSLQNIVMTAEDEQDFKNVMPFVMTNDTADEYIINYVGREKVDEITCYVFSVRPKVLTKDRKRYFEGQIWVDDQDLQIVKTFGRSTGHLSRGEDQQFPKFETYREQIDGKYWFPTYTYADDVLNFKDGPSQRIKEVIKYDQYKKWDFNTHSTITFGGQVPNPPPNPQKPPQ